MAVHETIGEESAQEHSRASRRWSSKRIRYAGLVAIVGALVGGLGWSVSSAVAVATRAIPPYGVVGSLPWRLIESSDGVAEVGMVVALVAFYAWRGDAYDWVGKVGFVLTAGGAASLVVSTVIWLANPADPGGLSDVFFIPGVLGTLLGYLVLGYGTYRTERFPTWFAAFLASVTVFFLVGNVALDYTGGAHILVALPWFGMAYALYAMVGDDAAQPA